MAFARAYFVLQGLAGILWWRLVFLSEPLRQATLGHLPFELAWLDVPLFVIASFLAAGRLRFAAWTILTWVSLVTIGMAIYATVTREAAWGAIGMAAALAGSAAAASLLILGRVPTDWLIRGAFVSRTTPDTRGHLLRTFRQLVAFWTVFLIVLPFALFELEQRWLLDLAFPIALRLFGFVLFVAASALGVASSLVMARVGEGTPLPSTMAKRLVIVGPYRVVRNPMAIAGIAQGVGVGLMLGSWMVVLYAVTGSMMWNWAIRPHEEADLVQRFGHEFEAYRSRVSCWWPKGYDPRIP